jgi:hypothetical protein
MKPASSTNEIEWELLPPEEKKKRASIESLFKWLALLMDNVVRVPGTNLRFGLDPIIGLIPGIGDTASAITSALALIYATRSGLPKMLIARMAGNILINELVGIIPGIGDAFSFWFKSNARNYDLIRGHIAEPRQSRKGDWVFLVIVLIGLIAIVCAGLLVSLLVFLTLGGFLFHK